MTISSANNIATALLILAVSLTPGCATMQLATQGAGMTTEGDPSTFTSGYIADGTLFLGYEARVNTRYPWSHRGLHRTKQRTASVLLDAIEWHPVKGPSVRIYKGEVWIQDKHALITRAYEAVGPHPSGAIIVQIAPPLQGLPSPGYVESRIADLSTTGSCAVVPINTDPWPPLNSVLFVAVPPLVPQPSIAYAKLEPAEGYWEPIGILIVASEFPFGLAFDAATLPFQLLFALVLWTVGPG